MERIESCAVKAARLASAHGDTLAVISGNKDAVFRDAGFIREETEDLGNIRNPKPLFRLQVGKFAFNIALIASMSSPR